MGRGKEKNTRSLEKNLVFFLLSNRFLSLRKNI